MKKYLPLVVPLGCIIALFIRILLIPNPGFEADVAFWKSWGLAVIDFGLIKGLPKTNFNYPTPFGYVLFVMVKVYSLFADPHNFYAFWKNTNILFLAIAKAPAILADFGIAGVFLYIGKHAKKLGFPPLRSTIYNLLAIIYLLNPISIIDGAWWGQLDSLGVFLFLLSFLLLLRRLPFWAGVAYMVAMMTKLQNMIYGPLFFLFVYQMTGFAGLVRAAAGALGTFGLLNSEFILSRTMWRVAESITGNYDYFPYLSLNAFNPWWIWTGGAGMKGSDKILTLGLASAKYVGLAFFSAGYLLATVRQYAVRTDKIRLFIENFMIVNGSFFFFQTESHDRYAFPFIIFLLLIVPYLKKSSYTLFSVFYLLFSGLYFYNLHTALIWNYPENGIGFLIGLTWPALTITVAYILTTAFILYIAFVSRDHLWMLVPSVVLVAGMLGVKNLPIFLHRPVRIEHLTPIQSTQGFGERMTDMPVNASLGFTSWSDLSVQYAFYRHGIGTHAKSTIVYDIGRLFTTFSFDYGIDTEAGPKGSVVYEVWGDDKKLFSSEPITRYQLPKHADVPVGGVRLLKLVVTDAGDGITDDHADWLNPQLYP